MCVIVKWLGKIIISLFTALNIYFTHILPEDVCFSFINRGFSLLNEGVYNFLKSNSQVYRFTYKLHFTILDYGQNFEGGFR